MRNVPPSIDTMPSRIEFGRSVKRGAIVSDMFSPLHATRSAIGSGHIGGPGEPADEAT
jgi:hypothetical protein